jgi:hypothetical protein
VAIFGVENNAILAWFHIHTASACAWRHVGVWRKTPLPHRNSQRKTLQTQKAIAFFCCLVAAAKMPTHIKESDKLKT